MSNKRKFSDLVENTQEQEYGTEIILREMISDVHYSDTNKKQSNELFNKFSWHKNKKFLTTLVAEKKKFDALFEKKVGKFEIMHRIRNEVFHPEKNTHWHPEWIEEITQWLFGAKISYFSKTEIGICFNEGDNSETEIVVKKNSWYITGSPISMSEKGKFVILRDKLMLAKKCPINLWINVMIKLLSVLTTTSILSGSFSYDKNDFPLVRNHENLWYVRQDCWRPSMDLLLMSNNRVDEWRNIEWPHLLLESDDNHVKKVDDQIDKRIILHTFFSLYYKCCGVVTRKWLDEWQKLLLEAKIAVVNNHVSWSNGYNYATMKISNDAKMEIKTYVGATDIRNLCEPWESVVPFLQCLLVTTFELMSYLRVRDVDCHNRSHRKLSDEKSLEGITMLGRIHSEFVLIEAELLNYLPRVLVLIVVDYFLLSDWNSFKPWISDNLRGADFKISKFVKSSPVNNDDDNDDDDDDNDEDNSDDDDD